jgi:hypothetical protein
MSLKLRNHVVLVIMIVVLSALSSPGLSADTIVMPNRVLMGKILEIDARTGNVLVMLGCESGNRRMLRWSRMLQDEDDTVIKLYFNPDCVASEDESFNPHLADIESRRPNCDNTVTGYRVRFTNGSVVWPRGRGGIDMAQGEIDLYIPQRGWFRGPASSIRSIEIATVCAGEEGSQSLPSDFKRSPQ